VYDETRSLQNLERRRTSAFCRAVEAGDADAADEDWDCACSGEVVVYADWKRPGRVLAFAAATDGERGDSKPNLGLGGSVALSSRTFHICATLLVDGVVVVVAVIAVVVVVAVVRGLETFTAGGSATGALAGAAADVGAGVNAGAGAGAGAGVAAATAVAARVEDPSGNCELTKERRSWKLRSNCAAVSDRPFSANALDARTFEV
jgi:hypothetical protein